MFLIFRIRNYGLKSRVKLRRWKRKNKRKRYRDAHSNLRSIPIRNIISIMIPSSKGKWTGKGQLIRRSPRNGNKLARSKRMIIHSSRKY